MKKVITLHLEDVITFALQEKYPNGILNVANVI